MKSLSQQITESLTAPYFYTRTVDEIIGMLYTLRMNTQVVHWNYTGENFLSFHEYLDSILNYVDGHIDQLAENQRTKDFVCKNPYLQIDMSNLIKPENEVGTIVNAYYKCLSYNAEEVSKVLKAIGTNEAPDPLFDKVNEDILIGLKTELDKSLWWIKSTFSLHS